MKNRIFVIAGLALGLMLLSVNTNVLSAQTNQNKGTMKQATKYTCPHHPDVVSDKPGKCNKEGCGMELVAMKEGKTSEMPDGMSKGDMKMKNDSAKMKKDGMKKSKEMKKDKMAKEKEHSM